jgi:hypothetical protein
LPSLQDGIRWGIGKLKTPQGVAAREISIPTSDLDIWRIRQTVIRNVTMLRSSKFSTKDFSLNEIGVAKLAELVRKP